MPGIPKQALDAFVAEYSRKLAASQQATSQPTAGEIPPELLKQILESQGKATAGRFRFMRYALGLGV